MAAAQPAQSGAPGDDIADWMAQRWRDIANLGSEAEDAGLRMWAQATRSGQDLAAPNTSDLRALGAQSLRGKMPPQPAASQQGDPSTTFVPSAGAPTLAALRQQQAQFGKIRNDLDIRYSPYALPALLPAALLAPEALAGIGIRGLLSAPESGAFDFPELDAWQSGTLIPCEKPPSAVNTQG
jgi:hypothetical protein